MPSLERQQRDAENRALREWAATQGIELPPTGRIPEEVRQMFRDAGGLEAVAAAAADEAVPPGPVASGFFPPPPDAGDVPPPPGSGTSSAKPDTGKKPSSPKGTPAELAAISGDLTDGLRIFGAGAMYVSPIAGRCIVDDADPVTVEIIRLGVQYPKFGEFLVEAAKVAPPLKLGKYGARWAVAAACDRGRIAIDSMPAQIFGVADVAQELIETGVITLSDTPPEPRKRRRRGRGDNEPADTTAPAAA